MKLFMCKIGALLQQIFWTVVALLLVPFACIGTLYHGLVHKNWCLGGWIACGEAFIEAWSDTLEFVLS